MKEEKIDFWGVDTPKKIVNTAWKGAKELGLAVVSLAALGLGLSALDSLSD